MKSNALHPAVDVIAICIVALPLLAACGGGGSKAPASQAKDQSISGVVIDGPIQGAVVCLDENSNGACDAGGPASMPTDAQGNYTISGLTSSQVNSGRSVLAVVPATAVDSVSGVVGTGYVLTAPAGKWQVVSPITTLVQAGVRDGTAVAQAEAAVARQLKVSTAALYENYATATGVDADALRTAAPLIVASLQEGRQLADAWLRAE